MWMTFRSLLRNLYFAASTQHQRIEVRDSDHGLWLGLLLLYTSALLHAGKWEILGITSFGALLAFLLRARSIDYQRLIIVTTGALLPAIGASAIGAPDLVTLALIFIGAHTIGQTVAALVRQRLTHSDENAPSSPVDSDEAQADALRRMRATRTTTLVEVGPTIGHFMSVAIPGWFKDGQGRTHEFVAAWTGRTPPALDKDESLLFPGLIYKLKRED